MVHAAIGVAQHRERRVVAHRADSLLGVLDHGMEDRLEVLDRPARRELAAAQFVGREVLGGRRVLADQRIELDRALGPARIVVRRRQHVLQLAVLVDPGLVHIDGQHLAGAEAALLDDLGLVLRHHAGLGAGDQQVLRRHDVAHRPQAVAVEPDQCPLAGDGGDGGRPVPWLHHAVHVVVHGAMIGRHVGVRGRGLGNHHRLDHRQVAMAAHQQLEHVVERRGIGGAGLHDRLQVLDEAAEGLVLEPCLVALHPVDVAQDGVDLAVVREHAEGLRQLPLREGVGRIALVEDREARGEALVEQVGIEGRQVLGEEHALVDDRPARQRADVELGDVLGERGLLHATAQDVELLLELAVVEPRIAAADQDLLDLGPGLVGLGADDRDVDRHLAPAQDRVAETQDLGLDDGAAALLRAEVGARQEHHADRDASDLRELAAGVADIFLEEVLRNLDVETRAIARLAVGVDGAAVPHSLQRIDARRHDVAASLAVQRDHETDAAGIESLGGVVAVGGGELLGAALVVADELLGIEGKGGHGTIFLWLLTPPALRATSPFEWGGSFPPPSAGEVSASYAGGGVMLLRV